MFDGVTRLGNNYLKMCSAGSILFKHLSFTFHCCPTRRVNTVVNFGRSTKMEKFRKNKDVADEVQQMCALMDDCYQDWLHHISVKRKKFYFLNHFTTAQLVILRQKVGVNFLLCSKILLMHSCYCLAIGL